MTQFHTDPGSLADEIIAATQGHIVMAMPLGLGKAMITANALVARAMADPSISLTILTALTLEKPKPGNMLERRFITPVIERLFGDYPQPAWTAPLRAGTLPDNIQIMEFFFLAGRWLSVPAAQQNYICANYTQGLQAILDRKPNVLAQIVARRETPDGPRISLSCNPDLSIGLLEARDKGLISPLLVVEENTNLPYMAGDAELPESATDHMLTGHTWPLFAPPREPVSPTDHAIGLQIARLVPDGGTLQIGIGSIGDAVAAGLVMRHTKPDDFCAAVAALEGNDICGPCDLEPFKQGIFGCSEMFVPAFLDLMEAGVLSREVDGICLEAGFFLGPSDFYQRLRDMDDTARARIAMRRIEYVNELYGDEETKRRARTKARFINSGMMATALGAVVSDGLEDGRVVSGVGGQYNFVAQAFALEGARSIIAIRATRGEGDKTASNIRWSYGHTTIPRHLRDIIVTEYGVADLRSKTDSEVIDAMLSVTDARFQTDLMNTAKANGKLAKSYQLPARYADNTPQILAQRLSSTAAKGDLPAFPFGTDFTQTELRLMGALERMRQAATSPRATMHLAAAGFAAPNPDETECLTRMQLANPTSLREKLYAAMLRGALRAQAE